MSSLFFSLFFYAFVEFVDKSPRLIERPLAPPVGAEGRWWNVALTGLASV